MKETILTKEFCLEALRKSIEEPESMTAEEARYIIYFQPGNGHEKECISEGTKMILTCDTYNCVNPDHVEMIPPNIRAN
jgi:hypothetical protein